MNRFIGLSLALLAGTACAQSEFKNANYGEVFGNGVVYSVNYERTFSNNIIAKAGFMGLRRGLVVPLMAGKYFGSRTDHFELMAGPVYYTYTDINIEGSEIRHSRLGATFFVGYRYQHPENRFLFRIGYTPIIQRRYYHWAGVGFAIRFGK